MLDEISVELVLSFFIGDELLVDRFEVAASIKFSDNLMLVRTRIYKLFLDSCQLLNLDG